MSIPRGALLALLAGALGCRSNLRPPAPATADSATYVVTLGSDTVAVDQSVRVADTIRGTLLTRTPRTLLTHYHVALGPAGTPMFIETRVRLPGGGLVPNAPRRTVARLTGDTIITQVERDTTATLRIPGRDVHAALNLAYSLYRIPIGALMASGRDSASFTTYSAGSRQTGTMPVSRQGPTRFRVWYFGAPQEVVVDDRGRLVSLDARATTFKSVATRVPAVDVPALAQSFAQRDARPAPLSPRDTVTATVGAAQIWVDYSRPAARGRKVFGATGVLGDTLWRTGANAATQFRTSAPLTVAGQTIPAGTYTLFTLAVPGRYQLIVNTQTGQWGTEHDPRRDLVRLPLQAAKLSAPVERFTIAVDPTGTNTGVLRLRWDDTELSLLFTTP